MRFQELKKYVGIFILFVALIIIYKTFDNFGIIIDFIKTVFQLLTPFFIGAAIAFVLRKPCKYLEELIKKTKIKPIYKHRRSISVLCVYAIVIAVISLIMYAIIPQLVRSVGKFFEQLPGMLDKLVKWINSFGFYTIQDGEIEKFLSNEIFSANRISELLNYKNINIYAKNVINLGSTVVDIFLGIVISVYILLERKSIKNATKRFSAAFLPEKFRNNVTYYCKIIGNFVSKYIGCQLLDAVIVFILSLIVLLIMQVEYASLIALMLGTFNLIPYFGAFIAIFISALIVLVTSGFMDTIILVIVLIVLQQIDANVIQPRLVGSSLSIKPLLVILGVILGGGLFGVLGIFLGVPIVALTKNIIENIIEKKNLDADGGKDDSNNITDSE